MRCHFPTKTERSARAVLPEGVSTRLQFQSPLPRRLGVQPSVPDLNNVRPFTCTNLAVHALALLVKSIHNAIQFAEATRFAEAT